MGIEIEKTQSYFSKPVSAVSLLSNDSLNLKKQEKSSLAYAAGPSIGNLLNGSANPPQQDASTFMG